MRLIRQYRFNIGTKISFAQWPEIVQQFLADNGLTSGRFMYYFSDYVFARGSRSKACDRILKDCPGLGEIRVDEGGRDRFDTWWVSNIDGESFQEERIRPLMNKIHRSYGFVDSCLYYYDIDFFGSVRPFERDFSVARRKCEREGIPYDPTKDIAWQPRGSGITLYRDGAFGKAWMEMTVDLLRDGKVMDAAPYKQAMLRLLPKMKVEETMEILLSEEEKQHIACLNEGAEEMLERCRSYLKERLWRELKENRDSASYSVATALKKLAKQHGYEYRLVWNGGVYALIKRTSRGNLLYIEAVSRPSHSAIMLEIRYQGVGYNHFLCFSHHTPTNQQELEVTLEKTFSVINGFEEVLLPKLDALFPESPPWFEAYFMPWT